MPQTYLTDRIAKISSITERLDIIASEFEQVNPRIALAIDNISDKLDLKRAGEMSLWSYKFLYEFMCEIEQDVGIMDTSPAEHKKVLEKMGLPSFKKLKKGSELIAWLNNLIKVKKDLIQLDKSKSIGRLLERDPDNIKKILSDEALANQLLKDLNANTPPPTWMDIDKNITQQPDGIFNNVDKIKYT